jgi:hypothetical protein
MSTSAPAPPPVKPSGFQKWHRLVLSFCFVIFTGELGLCLFVLPWLSNWSISYIPLHLPKLADFWMNHYFRGFLSGLGLLNIYIALSEVNKLVRTLLHK